MGKVTGISWTNHTFNPWWGCTKVSPGCDNCYADSLDARQFGQHPALSIYGQEEKQGAHWGKGAPRRAFSEKHWHQPMHWNREAEKEGRKHLVFCASMADVMDDEAPEGQRDRLWGMIDRTPWLIWQLLTKRPQRYAQYLPLRFKHSNVWLGTTAENQHFYDIRWKILRVICAQWGLVSWISYEPAIGELSMLTHEHFPNWIIFGGETGSRERRRPCDERWANSVRQECLITGTKFFMKQMGGLTPAFAKAAIPAHLQIHEFPEVAA